MKKPLLMAALFAFTCSSLALAGDKTEKERPAEIPEHLEEIKPGMEVELPPVAPLITYTQNYYQDNELKDKYFGKWGALSATILEIKEGPHKQHIYQVQIDEGVERKLWVASLVKLEEGMIKVGTKVKMLGLFDKTAQETEFMAKLSKDKDYLLAFCLHDLETGRPMYEPTWQPICLDWENGKRLRRLNP